MININLKKMFFKTRKLEKLIYYLFFLISVRIFLSWGPDIYTFLSYKSKTYFA